VYFEFLVKMNILKYRRGMRRMKVEYFIGIVPPEEYMKRIECFQRRWMNYLGVEPHITLKAQGGLTSDKK
jgi:hypothetical protein